MLLPGLSDRGQEALITDADATAWQGSQDALTLHSRGIGGADDHREIRVLLEACRSAMNMIDLCGYRDHRHLRMARDILSLAVTNVELDREEATRDKASDDDYRPSE